MHLYSGIQYSTNCLWQFTIPQLLINFKKTTLFNIIQANDKNYKSKEWVNRYVLSLVLNTVTDDDSVTSYGNLFHNNLEQQWSMPCHHRHHRFLI